MLTVCVLPAGWLVVALVVFASRKAQQRRLAADWPGNSRKWSPGA